MNPMPPTLFLLFAAQEDDARISFDVCRIVLPPLEISRLWLEIPPAAEGLSAHLTPVFAWLAACTQPGDYVLIQGEFGATFLLVNEALRLGLTPIYSTTRREAVEEHGPDGRVHLHHIFSHVRFRRYER